MDDSLYPFFVFLVNHLPTSLSVASEADDCHRRRVSCTGRRPKMQSTGPMILTQFKSPVGEEPNPNAMLNLSPNAINHVTMKPRADLLCGGSPQYPMTLPFFFLCLSLLVVPWMTTLFVLFVRSPTTGIKFIPGLMNSPKGVLPIWLLCKRISDEFRHHPECHSGQDSSMSNPSEVPLSLGNQRNVMRCDAMRCAAGLWSSARCCPTFFSSSFFMPLPCLDRSSNGGSAGDMPG